MARFATITDADLLDYVEGRMAVEDRSAVARRLAAEPALARRCERVRALTLSVRLLRAVLPVESVPQDWLDLLAKAKPH